MKATKKHEFILNLTFCQRSEFQSILHISHVHDDSASNDLKKNIKNSKLSAEIAEEKKNSEVRDRKSRTSHALNGQFTKGSGVERNIPLAIRSDQDAWMK